MTMAPAARHLSREARQYLSDPLPPPPPFDFSDHVAVAELRHMIHREWSASNDRFGEACVGRPELLDDVPAVRFASSEAELDCDEVIVHLHGGAYFLGSPTTNLAMIQPVVRRSNLPVVSIDYRLAPEYPCPAAIDDVVSACRALARDHRIVAVYGESAGGGLAVAATIALRDAGCDLPGRLGLLSPWVDLTLSGDTYRTMLHVDPDFPDPDAPPLWAAAYAGADPGDTRASPLFADLRGLPPTLIQVGGREIMQSDSWRLAAALRDVGVDTTLDVWDGLWHVWQMWPDLPESAEAFDQLTDHLMNG
jgi:acetyl esterase/lipase